MTFFRSVKVCFSKYFVTSGRAARSEYWFFVLFVLTGSFVANIIDALIYGAEILETNAGGPFFILFNLVTFFPNFSVFIRRLHDVGKPIYYIFIPVITFFAGVISGGVFSSYWGVGTPIVVFFIMISGFGYLLALTLLPSEIKENKYGAPPCL